MEQNVQPMSGSTMHASLMERVHEGMTVVDSAGEKVGTVEDLLMGDPGAATEDGNRLPDEGFLGDVAKAFGGDEREPDVPGPMRASLLRSGYIKVDSPGFLFETDRYVPADQIESVTDDTVRLRVTRDMLVKER